MRVFWHDTMCVWHANSKRRIIVSLRCCSAVYMKWERTALQTAGEARVRVFAVRRQQIQGPRIFKDTEGVNGRHKSRLPQML